MAPSAYQRKIERENVEGNFSILNSQERLFKMWATVEIVDTQGQILPIDQFRDVMPTLLSRTMPIHMYGEDGGHTNKSVGEVRNFEFGINPEYNEEGVLLTGRIYRGFPLDNRAWDELQQKIIVGVSIGGQSNSKLPGATKWIAPCEVTLTPKPSNRGAKIVAVAMAKSEPLTPGGAEEKKEHPQLTNAGANEIDEQHKELGKEAGSVEANKEAELTKAAEKKEEEPKKEKEEEKKEGSEKKESKEKEEAETKKAEPPKKEGEGEPKKEGEPKQEEKKEPEKSEESEAKPSPDDPSKHHERISVLEKCVSQMAKEIADVREALIKTAYKEAAVASVTGKEPMAKTAEAVDTKKAAVADMQKSATQTASTPRPEAGSMQFDPAKTGEEGKISAADIARGKKTFDLADIARGLS